ncbi:MAG: cell division protein FtsB [Gammaproteobacteria bacterium]|nr:cell division protein FtsB [Gammaproteobacteria bacterium]
MRWLIGLLFLLFVTLQYRLWVGEGSLAEVHNLKQEIDAQKHKIEQLQERNRNLQAEVENLKQGKDAIEERARSGLGMIRENETYYQVIEPEQTAPQ